MTVIVMSTKTDGFTIKGDIKKFDNITQISDKGKTVELIRNKNYASIINKERNRIIAVEF